MYLSDHPFLLGSAVIKLSGKQIKHFLGPAACFDDEYSAFNAIMEGEIEKGQVLIIRYEGPKVQPHIKM